MCRISSASSNWVWLQTAIRMCGNLVSVVEAAENMGWYTVLKLYYRYRLQSTAWSWASSSASLKRAGSQSNESEFPSMFNYSTVARRSSPSALSWGIFSHSVHSILLRPNCRFTWVTKSMRELGSPLSTWRVGGAGSRVWFAPTTPIVGFFKTRCELADSEVRRTPIRRGHYRTHCD
jgi:hypothetical protein